MFRFGDPGGRIYGALGTNNANILSHWTNFQFGNNGTIAISASNGRNTGSCLRMSGLSNSSGWFTKGLDSQATWGVAFALKISAFPSASTTLILCSLVDVFTIQCDLRLVPDGTLIITRNGTTLGTTAALISLNTWIHIEFKVTIHPSTGIAQLWINGVSRLNLTAQNTRFTSNSTANIINVCMGQGQNNVGAGNYDFDDIIIYDGQTTDANGLTDITGPIGDCALTWLLPSGAGTTTQYTPDSGTNYARVNETTVDTTTYVESSTVNQIDTYAMVDLPSTAVTVKSLAVVQYARKTDAGSRGMKADIRSGGTDYTHATEIALSDSFIYNFSNWGQNPNTSANWTVSDVNALEAGQKVSS